MGTLTNGIAMTDPFVAIVVTVPEEFFPDDDEICLTAARFVCGQLQSHLVDEGHSIPAWIDGGCDEDWGVYFESQLNESKFEFHIAFFPSPRDAPQNQMVVQYHLCRSLISRLIRKDTQLQADHPMHETMRAFGRKFGASQMLTQSQFRREY